MLTKPLLGVPLVFDHFNYAWLQTLDASHVVGQHTHVT